MKKLLSAVLLLCALVAIGGDVRFNLRDFIVSSDNLLRRNVEVAPLSTPLASGTNVIISEARYFNTSTNGEFTATNMVAGVYKVTVFGPTRQNIFFMDVPTFSGETNASSLIVSSTANTPWNDTIKTNGVNVSTAARSLDFITGTDIRLLATNTSGAVTLQINSTAVGGSTVILTNANQFGESVTLTLKDGAVITNLSMIATGNANALRVTNSAVFQSKIQAPNVLYSNVTYVNASNASSHVNGMSLTNAIQAATAGSIVIVGPGNYYVATNTEPSALVKRGVDILFHAGSILGVSDAATIFDDIGGATTNRILGFGKFYITNSSGIVLYTSQSDSDFYFEHDEMHAIGSGCILLQHDGGKMVVKTRTKATTDTYDGLIATSPAAFLEWEIPYISVGGDIIECNPDAYALGRAMVRIGRGIGGSGGMLKLSKNLRIDFNRLEVTAASPNGVIFNLGECCAMMVGGELVHTNSASTNYLVGPPFPLGNSFGNSGIHFRNVIFSGSSTHDLFMISNSAPSAPMILENCTIFPGANSTNIARAATTPASVEIRGTLHLMPHKPFAANVSLLGTNRVANSRATTLFAETSIDTPGNGYINELYATNFVLNGGLFVFDGTMDPGATNIIDSLSEITAPATGDQIFAVDVSAQTLGWINAGKFASNYVRVAAGSGGITVTPSGSGGVMTYTISDDDAGGGGAAGLAPFIKKTNSPPTIAVGSTVENAYYFATNANFTLSFSGTATNGELVSLTVSNYAPTTDITVTLPSDVYDLEQRAVASSIVVMSNSVEVLRFRNNTNMTGSTRWELRRNGALYNLAAGANITLTTNGTTVTIATGAGVGEANVNGEVAVTNATMMGLVYGKADITNLLRAVSARYGLVATNESTNISFAINPSVVPSQTELNAASNVLRTDVLNLQGATNGIMTRIGNLDGSTNAIDALARTKQDGTLTLTNLSGTGAVTNLYSPTLSNATIKPLVVGVGTAAGATNTTGQIRGLEAGSNVTLSENGSNVVIAATSGSGVPSLLTPAVGSFLSSDGTNAAWSLGGISWWPVVDETWIGLATTNSPARADLGRELWNRSFSGQELLGLRSGIPNKGLTWVLTNAAQRTALYLGDQSVAGGWISTNSEFLIITRVYIGTLNNGTDVSGYRYGLQNSASAESTSGIYWRATNNVWEAVTARNGSRTVSTSSNLVEATEYCLGIRLDATGTNAIFYLGGTELTMTSVATNSSNIPHDFITWPTLYFHKYAGTSTRITNRWDYFRMFARRTQ